MSFGFGFFLRLTLFVLLWFLCNFIYATFAFLLSEEARQAVKADDTVFVLARAVSGPPMPLAARKLTVADLPQVITLSDAQAMAPGMNISSYDQLTLVARVSASGQPQPQSGDWQALKTPVSNQEESMIRLVVDEQIP
ncbi:MAG: hypothetical protein CMI02_01675 [Oceanospirillaceae bacterium]|nr:hypothetical protein [Oceanospirillaceae bacterium]